MSRYRQYSSQILTPLRENPPCLELPSRSEAYGRTSSLGPRGGVIEAGWPSCTAYRERSRGDHLRGHGPDGPTPKDASTRSDQAQRIRGKYLRQRSLPVPI